MSLLHRYRHRLLGLFGVLLIVGVVALSGAVYARVFSSVVLAIVDADRSGLLLEPKADVAVRGVNVGQVRDIEPVNGRARITVEIESTRAEGIPSNATATIAAPTVFGPKFVDMSIPSEPARPLRDNDVIRVTSTTTEINEVFDGLMTLLTNVEPSKLNATLGAISTALRGRGADIGGYLSELNDFLVRFNPQLPLLQRDLQRGADVVDIYTRAAPDILRILDNATVLSRTLQDKEAGLDALILSFTRLGDEATGFVSDVRPDLRQSLSVLRPTTGLLAEYSSTFPCLLAGTNNLRKRLSLAAGDGPLPGIGIFASFLPPQDGYKNPADLPKIGAKDPPNCRRNPLPPSVTPVPFTKLNDGVTTVDFTRSRGLQPITPQELAQSLFGPDILPLLGTPTALAAGGLAPGAPLLRGGGR